MKSSTFAVALASALLASCTAGQLQDATADSQSLDDETLKTRPPRRPRTPSPVPAPSTAPAYYVANNGNDTNPGTLSAPFLTAKRCAEVAQAGVTCFLRAGIYRETVVPAISGTASAPITFTSYPGETAVISGADVVSGWQPYKGNIYATKVTLPTKGYSDPNFFANQLFYSGSMMPEARWPNAGASLFDAGRYAVAGSNTDPGNLYDKNLPTVAGGWTGGYIYFAGGEWWTSQTAAIAADYGAGHLGIDTSTAVKSGPLALNANSGYYVFGKLAALDSPGEWFYDGSALYFWSPTNGVPENVEVKKRNIAFDLTNKSFIVVKNLSVTAATVVTDYSSSNNVIDNIKGTYVSHYASVPWDAAATDGWGGIFWSYVTTTGILLRGQNEQLINSEIAFSAGNCVSVQDNGSRVYNNYLHDCNYGATYTSAIHITTDGNALIASNTIRRTGRDGSAMRMWKKAGIDMSFKDVRR